MYRGKQNRISGKLTTERRWLKEDHCKIKEREGNW